jgi:hypothetical protein
MARRFTRGIAPGSSDFLHPTPVVCPEPDTAAFVRSMEFCARELSEITRRRTNGGNRN